MALVGRKNWSHAAFSDNTAEEAAFTAKKKFFSDEIKWTNYWPKNARVQKTKP